MNEVASRIAPPASTARQTRMDAVRSLLKVSEFVIFLVVILLLIGGSLINPRILGIENMKIITRDTAILAIAAIGVAFPIITGGIDLSIGSIVGLGGVLSTYFIMKWGVPIAPGIFMALGVGVIIGWIHGWFCHALEHARLSDYPRHIGGCARGNSGHHQWHSHYRHSRCLHLFGPGLSL
ncbi:MAG: hypothetical protein R2867_45815 [Caldilineaceae bacterium]